MNIAGHYGPERVRDNALRATFYAVGRALHLERTTHVKRNRALVPQLCTGVRI